MELHGEAWHAYSCAGGDPTLQILLGATLAQNLGTRRREDSGRRSETSSEGSFQFAEAAEISKSRARLSSGLVVCFLGNEQAEEEERCRLLRGFE